MSQKKIITLPVSKLLYNFLNYTSIINHSSNCILCFFKVPLLESISEGIRPTLHFLLHLDEHSKDDMKKQHQSNHNSNSVFELIMQTLCSTYALRNRIFKHTSERIWFKASELVASSTASLISIICRKF